MHQVASDLNKSKREPLLDVAIAELESPRLSDR